LWQKKGKNLEGGKKIEFDQALSEAEAFCLELTEGKWSTETPKEVMQTVAKHRPLSYVSAVADVVWVWEWLVPLCRPHGESLQLLP
jgi:hypothetical protein